MLTLRRSQDRGYADHGWLKSYHSFSFADYHDPAHMGWGNLRVINEDWIAPGKGFGTHGHRDMEIITYVLSGLLAHRDSMGNGTAIPPGDVLNHAADETTHFLQIWIMPNENGIAPGYEQKTFDADEKRGRLRLVASSDGSENSVTVHADASLYAGLLDGAESVTLPLNPARKAYVHLVRGMLKANNQLLREGDAALLANEGTLVLSDGKDAEVLVFDLAP
ncbi:MAG: pirin family protein [Proteobacteria bacterium]|nr:pirin family protein [Pseudomonadota bacterium]